MIKIRELLDLDSLCVMLSLSVFAEPILPPEGLGVGLRLRRAFFCSALRSIQASASLLAIPINPE